MHPTATYSCNKIQELTRIETCSSGTHIETHTLSVTSQQMEMEPNYQVGVHEGAIRCHLQVKSIIWLFCSLIYENGNLEHEGRRTQGKQVMCHVGALNSYLFM